MGKRVCPVNVAVADTSILRDLERGGLIGKCFDLPYQFTVPDLLYRIAPAISGCDPGFGEALVDLGLRVEELNGDEVSSAILFRRKIPTLSLPDSFALALAATRQWILLTGDDVLHAIASTLSVVCHGVLWIFDQLFYAGVSSPEDLVSGLSAIRGHPRCRLPQNEIAARIDLYSTTTKSS